MAQITIKIPSFLAKFRMSYIKNVVVEIIQTSALAGAGAGLVALSQQIPAIGDHYGFSPLVTAQMIAIVGYARVFVSGLNSKKQGSDPVPPPVS